MKKKVVPTWVSVVLLTLSIISATLEVYFTANFELSTVALITNVVFFIATVSATLYCLHGYQKAAAPYFKLAVATFLISECLSVLTTAILGLYFPATFGAVIFGCLSFLCLVKDLGKRVSFTMGGIIIGSSMLITLYYFFTSGLINALICFLTNTALTIVLMLMIYAKYLDKTSRGTK